MRERDVAGADYLTIGSCGETEEIRENDAPRVLELT
jgi:hypothetical protein